MTIKDFIARPVLVFGSINIIVMAAIIITVAISCPPLLIVAIPSMGFLMVSNINAMREERK